MLMLLGYCTAKVPRANGCLSRHWVAKKPHERRQPLHTLGLVRAAVTEIGRGGEDDGATGDCCTDTDPVVVAAAAVGAAEAVCLFGCPTGNCKTANDANMEVFKSDRNLSITANVAAQSACDVS